MLLLDGTTKFKRTLLRADRLPFFLGSLHNEGLINLLGLRKLLVEELHLHYFIVMVASRASNNTATSLGLFRVGCRPWHYVAVLYVQMLAHLALAVTTLSWLLLDNVVSLKHYLLSPS